MQKDLEELHRQASGHYLKGEFDEAMAAWRQALEIKPDDERGREGIRLCEQLAGTVEEGITAELPPQEAAPAEPPPAPAAPPPAATVRRIDEAAANELKLRIEELLAEARSLVESGDQDAVLRTIDRVLILDEENEEALTLRDGIRGPDPDGDPALEIDPVLHTSLGSEPPAPAPEPETSASPPLILQNHDDHRAKPLSLSDDAAPREAAPEPEPVPAKEPASNFEPAVGPEMFLKLDPDLLDAELTATEQTVAPEGRSKLTLPPWLQDRRVQLGGGGAIVLVAVFLTLRMFQGGADPLPDPLAPVEREVKPAVADTEQPPPPEPTVTDVGVAPDTLMREADEAFDDQNYAAAVIAYDRVLKEQPDNTEARVKMRLATERYRDQKARQQRWDSAAAAFEQQNYAEAMRYFYRMKNEEYEADIDRLKVNGWYNLGLTALQAKDCPRAIEHFDEALNLDAGDPEVLAAIALAETCRGDQVTAEIRRLTYRSLTD